MSATTMVNAVAKPRRGRRGALTPELHAKFLEHLRAGLFQGNAAELIGVHATTVDQWLSKGRDELADATEQMDRTGRMPPLGRYAQFAVEVEAARARTEAELVGTVVEIATLREPDTIAEDGTRVRGKLVDAKTALAAVQWYLERVNNRRYGRGALRIGVDLPGMGVPTDDEDPVDLVLERLDTVEENLRAVTGDTSSSSTADE